MDYTVSINDVSVTIPQRYLPGHVLTENQALILDRAVRNQFVASMARENGTRKDKGEAPLDAETLAERYADFEPTVSGTVRASSLEKIRDAAGLRALVELFDEHNAAIAEGRPGVLATTEAVKLPAGKGSAELKAGMVAKILANPVHAERVQRHIDAITAERGKTEAKAAVATVDLL